MKKIVSTCVQNLVPFKNFAFLYSRVGAGPGAGGVGVTLKIFPGAGAA
jgi:hypothetical protein